MCGRYPSPSAPQMNEVWGIKPDLRDEDIPWIESPNFDARPTQSLPIVRTDPEKGLVIEYARWGLVPAWFKKPLKELGSTINATAEKIKAKSGMWWGPF